MRTWARAGLLVWGLLACGGPPPSRDDAIQLPGPEPRERPKEPPAAPPRLLAFWNGASTGGICWLGQDDALECRTLSESCELGGELPLGRLGRRALSLTHGYRHTCALTPERGVACFGDNSDAQLGSRDGGPARLAGPATDVSGGFDHTCAALASGDVQCWGDNSTGQLALPAIPYDRPPRSLLPDESRVLSLGRRALQVSAGGGHSCALLDGGEVRCWGDSRGKKLGHDASHATPWTVAVPIDGPAISIEAGTWTTCATLADGRVQCWGTNEYGLLCDDGPDRTQPTHIPLPGPARSVSLADTRACALLTDGRVACWGGACQAKSCDPNAAPPPSGACKPSVELAKAGPARGAIVGDVAVCALAGSAPTCACRKAP